MRFRLEPVDRVGGGEVVDLGRAAACVDRSAHEDEAARLRLARGRHERGRRQHGHGRLADGDDVQALGPDVADELADVADVIVEREGAAIGRDVARVDPVGDVDLVGRQQRAHRVAQQRRVVAGERRDDQDRRFLLQLGDDLRLVAVALEAEQPAEGLVQHRLFDDGHLGAVDGDLGDAEGRLVVALPQPVEQLVPGGDVVGAGQLGEPASRFGEHPGRHLSHLDGGRHQSAVVFEEAVQQGPNPFCRAVATNGL